MKKASSAETAELVELMAEFYAESGYPLNRQRATATFTALLSDSRLGHTWLIRSGGKTAGYVVVVMGYSMEYGGLIAYVDDLFIRPAFRRAGLGTEALTFVRSFCTSVNTGSSAGQRNRAGIPVVPTPRDTYNGARVS